MDNVRDGLSRFAGRKLTMSEDVYESETATNMRNQGIAHLLASYGGSTSIPTRPPTSTPGSAPSRSPFMIWR